jgi:hypothetical protein
MSARHGLPWAKALVGLKETPRLSDRVIAKRVGCGNGTVLRARRELARRAPIEAKRTLAQAAREAVIAQWISAAGEHVMTDEKQPGYFTPLDSKELKPKAPPVPEPNKVIL